MSSGAEPVSAYRQAFWWMIAFAALAAVITPALPRETGNAELSIPKVAAGQHDRA
ncbi:hypothetical protein JCM9957A_67090 [Kineosporia succinea]